MPDNWTLSDDDLLVINDATKKTRPRSTSTRRAELHDRVFHMTNEELLTDLLSSGPAFSRASGRLASTTLIDVVFTWVRAEIERGTEARDIMAGLISAFLSLYLTAAVKTTTPTSDPGIARLWAIFSERIEPTLADMRAVFNKDGGTVL